MLNLRLLAAVLSVLCGIVLLGGDAQAGQSPQAIKARHKPHMTVVTYSVADLVVPIDAHVPPARTIEETLILLISNTIDRQSWADFGGPATIQYYPLGLAMVINQTPANHKKVADLLASLRRLQDVEVAVELRLVELAPEMAKHFVDLAGFQTLHGNDPRRSIHTAYWNDLQLKNWMGLLQYDRATNTMQTPKVTVFNGQSCTLTVGDERATAITQAPKATVFSGGGICVMDVRDELAFLETINAEGIPVQNPKSAFVGLRANVLPVVSADRRYVRLHLDLSHASVAPLMLPITVIATEGGVERVGVDFNKGPEISILALDTTLVLPDGGTFVCSLGKTVVETRTQCGPQVLSDIPLINWLFKNVEVSHEEREVFLMVTTRVIVNEEEQVQAVAVPATGQSIAPKGNECRPTQVAPNPTPDGTFWRGPLAPLPR
jgi:general secretion pathway protein D